MTVKSRWVVITGKKPDLNSSVGAYTRNITKGLIDAGEHVEVFYPEGRLESKEFKLSQLNQHPNLSYHQIPSKWESDSFNYLNDYLSNHSIQNNLMVQFSPGDFGNIWNPSLPKWLEFRKLKGDKINIIVHKTWDDRVKKGWLFNRIAHRIRQNNLLKNTLSHCHRVFVTTPNWIPQIHSMDGYTGGEIIWIPTPSNVDRVDNSQKALNLRKAFAHEAPIVIGSFGSYNNAKHNRRLETLLLKLLLKNKQWVWLCLGKGSESFTEKMKEKHPDLAGRIETSGELDQAALSAHIQACDLMVQIYPQGVDTSRTSIMVGLSHGKPIVTTAGSKTEEIWYETSCVSLAPSNDIAGLQKSIELLISNPQKLVHLGHRAFDTYKKYFSLEHCVNTLRSSSVVPISEKILV